MSQVDVLDGAGAAEPGSGDVAGQGDTPGGAAAQGTEAGGAGGGKSLLTRDDGDEPGSGQGTPDGKEADADAGEKDVDQAALVPTKPEGYALTFAEGVVVDEGLLNSFKATAHELGIPQGQAQKLADFYANNVLESVKAAQDAQAVVLDQARQGWEAEIRARPGFRQEEADAKRTLKEFGSPELAGIMDQTLLGSHPVFFDFVVKVGKALAEPEARGRGTGGGREKPLADRLWPDMK